MACAQPKNYR